VASLNLAALGTGEIIRIGPIQVRVLEDGSRTDNRIGAAEITVPARTPGPPQHVHRVHDETFLITRGALRFIVGEAELDARAGDYVVVPVGAKHTFANPFDEPAVMFNSFTPAYYINYFREVARVVAAEGFSPEGILRVMARYATEPA
jgi:mannose-6-phosphate isomerase-like protein (cupin superfamily)